MSDNTKVLTYREKLVIRILCLIATMAAEDDTLKAELRSLNAHVSCGLGESSRT